MHNIVKAAFRQYILKDVILISSSSSAGINKATHEKDCLLYVFCSTLLAFGIRESRTPETFEIKLFVKHLKWSPLRQNSTTGNCYYCYKEFHLICNRSSRSTSENHR